MAVTADLQEAMEVLEGMDANMRRVRRYMLTAISREGAKHAKKAYALTGLHKGTGQLYKSISGWVGSRGNNVWAYVGYKRKKGEPDISYGYMLAHGYRAIPKRIDKETHSPKAMQFMTKDGKWVTAKSFTSRTYDVVEGPVTKWMRTTAFYDKVDDLLQRQIDNIMAKRKVEDE